MSLFNSQATTEVIPEYQKSLFDWGGARKGKQFTPNAPHVTTVKVKLIRRAPPAPHASVARSSSTSSSAPIKRVVPSAPVSTASVSSSLSSPTSLYSSANPAEDLDTRLSRKQKINNANTSYSSGSVSHLIRDTSPLTSSNTTMNDASSVLSLPSSTLLKRVRSVDDAPSSLAGDSEVDEVGDTSLVPSPPKRVKKLKDASLACGTDASPSMSADTSRASSPAPSGKSSASKKSTSRGANGATKKVKRRKKRALTDLTLPPKRGSFSRVLEPVMVRDTSTPRSLTAGESETCHQPHEPRTTWTEEDGHVADHLRTSEAVVRRLADLGRYKTLFRNPNDPDDKTYELSELPTVELEYPNTGANESFLLARPKDEDHYDPTYDIENTLRTFIKDIIPPEYKDVLGPLPEDAIYNIADSDGSVDARSSSVAPVLSSISPSRAPGTLTDSECGTPPPLSSSPRGSPSPKGLMRTLLSARRRRDGPMYKSTLEEINRCIRELKGDESDRNVLRHVPRTWSNDGIPLGVVVRIIEETYQRCVGPQIPQLRKYEAFSSNVYGELTPTFVNDIIERTRLHSKSLLLDLGSGVGNVVLQAALQTGCRAFGIEEREDTARIADDQLEQAKLRCRMWGVTIGEVELVQGDMTASPRVDELMSQADVVLVNNYVFSEELNAALRPKFLDLKEGAYVVSLKPFAPPQTQMLTERNYDDISAIFDVSQHPYESGTVSWSSGSGIYYVHHVNREGYRRNRETFERRRGRRR